MEDRYETDFISRNGTWVLSMFGVLSACLSALLVYFLKSRCRSIKCCGFECEREVLDLNAVPDTVVRTGIQNTAPRAEAVAKWVRNRVRVPDAVSSEAV